MVGQNYSYSVFNSYPFMVNLNILAPKIGALQISPKAQNFHVIENCLDDSD
jgi:hypothetical protein